MTISPNSHAALNPHEANISKFIKLAQNNSLFPIARIWISQENYHKVKSTIFIRDSRSSFREKRAEVNKVEINASRANLDLLLNIAGSSTK